MNFYFDEKLNEFLKILTKNARAQKIRVFFVGGIVRDRILNIPVKDIDIIIEGNAIEFSKNLPENIKIKSIHKDFATVKVEFSGREFDIASTRTENYPHSGCLPVVEKVGVPIEIDAKRRDFTVNSLYCELCVENNEIKYKLIDFFEGKEDISKKTLKVLHPKSYIDDPTRILRGLGFKYRFGFDFSDFDKKLIEEYLQNPDNLNASIDRELSVCKKLLDSSFAPEIIKEIVEKRYFRIFSSLQGEALDIEKIFKIKDAFFLDCAEFSQFFLHLLKNLQPEKFNLKTPLEIYKTFSKFDKSALAFYFYKTRDENTLLFNKFKDIKPNIKGADLIALNYKEGRLLGEILDALLAKKLENPELFPDKTAEIDWILKSFPLK